MGLEVPSPWLRTVTLSVRVWPAIGLLSLTVSMYTRRSGGDGSTVTATASEQLFATSTSKGNGSTQTP